MICPSLRFLLETITNLRKSLVYSHKVDQRNAPFARSIFTILFGRQLMKCESILSVFLKIYINFIKPKSMKIEIFLVAECIYRLHSAKCRLNFMLTPDFRLNLLPQWFGIRTLTITEIFIRNYYRLRRKVKFRFIKLSYKIAPLFSSKTTILFGRQLLQTESIFS